MFHFDIGLKDCWTSQLNLFIGRIIQWCYASELTVHLQWRERCPQGSPWWNIPIEMARSALFSISSVLPHKMFHQCLHLFSIIRLQIFSFIRCRTWYSYNAFSFKVLYSPCHPALYLFSCAQRLLRRSRFSVLRYDRFVSYSLFSTSSQHSIEKEQWFLSAFMVNPNILYTSF